MNRNTFHYKIIVYFLTHSRGNFHWSNLWGRWHAGIMNYDWLKLVMWLSTTNQRVFISAKHSVQNYNLIMTLAHWLDSRFKHESSFAYKLFEIGQQCIPRFTIYLQKFVKIRRKVYFTRFCVQSGFEPRTWNGLYLHLILLLF